jgi:hypothetical protein
LSIESGLLATLPSPVPPLLGGRVVPITLLVEAFRVCALVLGFLCKPVFAVVVVVVDSVVVFTPLLNVLPP